MTTPAPTKRSVGRPRKNVKKQENPDCEVASKGYVKFVARKLGEHTHENFVIVISSGVLAIIGVFGLLYIGNNGYMLPQISIPTMLMTFAIIGGYNMIVGTLTHYLNTDESEDMPRISDIQEYSPPVRTQARVRGVRKR